MTNRRNVAKITKYLSTMLLLLLSKYALGRQTIECSKPPLSLSDGTHLPEPFTTDTQLRERIQELQKQYESFTRNLTPPKPCRQPVAELSSLEWFFKDDSNDWGELKRWFATEVSDNNGWNKQPLPDHREFARGWYRTKFDAPVWKSDRIFLRFEGVDYGARVFLNERYIGEHTGYFMPFEFDVTNVLKPTGNILAIRVDNPVSYDGQQDSFQGDGMGTVAFNKARGVVQFSNAGGIFQPVKLIGRSSINVNNLKVTPKWPDMAVIDVSISNLTENPTNLKVEVSVFSRNFESEGSRLEQGIRVSKENTESFCLKLVAPKFWTPDTPYLYTARVAITDTKGNILECVEEPFGMRWFEQDVDGSLMLNKERFFVRGSGAFGNFWLASVHQDRKSIIDDILLFKAANLNMTRPHIHVLPKIFYEYADMYGLMIYMDMPLNAFEGSVGRSDIIPIYTEEIKRQAIDMVNYLYNHPSIAIWEVANESQTNKPVPQQITPSLKEIVRVLREIDSTRLPVASSGFTQPMGGGNKEWWGLSDDHYYTGWYVKTPAFLEYRTECPSKPPQTKDKILVTEYGAAAFPRWETWVDSFPWGVPASPDELFDVRRIPREFPYRGTPYLGAGDVFQLRCADRYYGEFARPSDWIKHSQAYQAYVVKANTDIFRRRLDINGYIHFFLIDPGPAAWPKAIVDYQRRPLDAYFALAQASAPCRINIQYEGRRFYSDSNMVGMRLWMYNDPNRPLKASVRAVLSDDSGNILAEQEWKDRTFPGAAHLYLDDIHLHTPVVKEGRRKLFLYAILSNGTNIVNYDCLPIEVFTKEQVLTSSRIAVYDNIGKTASVLQSARVEFKEWKPGDALTDISLLVIGAYSSDKALLSVKNDIRVFLEKGGSVLVLNQTFPGRTSSEAFSPNMDYFMKVAMQSDAARASRQTGLDKIAPCDPGWLPFPLSFSDPGKHQICSLTLPVGCPAIVAGLNSSDLSQWYGGNNYVVEYPIDMRDEEATQLSCGGFQRCSSVIVKSVGQGKLLFSQLLLVDRYGIDPVATYILNRMLEQKNWIKLPDISVAKEASVTNSGSTVNIRLIVTNPTDVVIEGDLLDQVFRDPPRNVKFEKIKEKLKLSPGESRVIQFSRKLPDNFIGDLAPAVFVFEDGRWITSNTVTLNLDFNKLEVIRAFDFGTHDSPVAAGYSQITQVTYYKKTTGYGWIDKGNPIWAGDFGTGDDLTRDFVIHQSNGCLRVDLPAGEYVFQVMAGDIGSTLDIPFCSDAVSPVVFSCNGKEVGRLVRLLRRSFATLTFKYRLEKDGPVDISFACPYESNLCPITALTVYRDMNVLPGKM